MNIIKHTLSNGLKVLISKNTSTPISYVNILYNVGAKHEDPEKTGFAHLFEHLMFGGSRHVHEYDHVIEEIGGENNAFTNNDFTNYYVSFPGNNLDTVLWAESDRMNDLAINEEKLTIQKQVVIEEFKQRYLNAPYGRASHELRKLSYQVHPYRWPTIGLELNHIERATLQDVQTFYEKWYNPDNAILVYIGPIDPEEVFKKIEYWFGDIRKNRTIHLPLPAEPSQTEKRQKILKENVPFRAVYRAYHMPSRMDPQYVVCDLISDLLSEGRSGRLEQHLVKDNPIFSSISAYVGGDIDPGLFYIVGELRENVSWNQALTALDKELHAICEGNFSDDELIKAINQHQFVFSSSLVSMQERAVQLAFFELLGDWSLLLRQNQIYQSITRDAIIEVAQQIFSEHNCSEILYEPLDK
ncbi:MAG: insulinase family protein [Bacteroidales bacterium]|nr:insulinase family protein [Bacteroidales bacterium]